ncbi:MAG TPA: hypothetical protein VMS31_10575 [Pyrinomonadaceae bacterium]|nr:hypothetical protein [Pyrinomonadaceae bacterium]
MKVLRKAHLKKLIEERSFTEAFALGREIVASEPQDVGTLFTLIDGGLFALSSGNTTFVPDASDYAKRALKLIESNRAWPESRGKNLGWLNYTLGIFLLTSAPTEAANYLYKAMQFEPFNLDASIYALLADALLGAQYIPIQQEFEARFKTYAQKLSLQAEPLRAKLNLAADHLIQALARAVALAGSNAKFAQAKAVWLKDLTELYKFRNSGYETGLSEYIEAALDKPLRSDILRF